MFEPTACGGAAAAIAAGATVVRFVAGCAGRVEVAGIRAGRVRASDGLTVAIVASRTGQEGNWLAPAYGGGEAERGKTQAG